MKDSKMRIVAIISLGLILSISACKKDDNKDEPKPEPVPTVNTPATYEFSRDGQSSVSYQGQIDRLNQTAEMKAYVKDAAINGTAVSAQKLIDMFENTAGDGNGNFSFTSAKQLKDKCFQADVPYFMDAFQSAEDASDSSTVIASNGTAGFLLRGNGKNTLVDANGHDFTEIIEKGMMGAVFYNQMVNNYLTADKIGAAVNNTDLESGKNYTAMEHHLDEAFGYFGVPVDFKSNYNGTGNPVFWGEYCNSADSKIGSNYKLMNAFKTARAAIVAQKMSIKDAQVAIIHNEMQTVIAASAIHYINSSKLDNNDGDRMHHLSECYYLLKSLRYANFEYRKISQAELNNFLDTDFGINFWQVSTTGLDKIKTKLSDTYNLNSVKDIL